MLSYLRGCKADGVGQNLTYERNSAGILSPYKQPQTVGLRFFLHISTIFCSSFNFFYLATLKSRKYSRYLTNRMVKTYIPLTQEIFIYPT